MDSAKISVPVREDLLKEAAELAGTAAPDAVVEQALQAYVNHLHRLEAVKLFGTIDFHEDFDVKALRRNRSDKRNVP